MAEDTEEVREQEAGEGESALQGGKKKLLLLAAAALILALGGGAFLMLGGEAEEAELADGEAAAEGEAEEAPAEAHYFSLDPAFVVNFQSEGRRRSGRFLQVTLDAMTHDEAVMDAVQRHMPVIRNNLVLLFSQQSYEGLMTNEGKERLRTETLNEIRAVLEERIGEPGVEEVYFTSFVMQ